MKGRKLHKVAITDEQHWTLKALAASTGGGALIGVYDIAVADIW